jgi:hypothetical protein
MTRWNVLKKIERFETHHRIAVFCILIVATILVTRVAVWVHNPNPVVFGLELHHFDYGIFLLMIVAQLSLFGPRRWRDLYIFLTAIASSLILDEYWMIRRGTGGYDASFFSVLMLSMGVVLTILFVSSLLKKKI